MKVKVLSRNPDDFMRETKRDIHKVPRNYDPNLHPFEAQREYTKALNAAKLGRLFAKPFVGSLEGHRDGLSRLAKHPKQLSTLLSGSCDGEIRLWDLPQQRCLRHFKAHNGKVNGITFFPNGDQFITVGFDKTVKMWDATCPDSAELVEPTNTILSKTILTGVSHNQIDPTFATCGDKCQIWDETRNEPISSHVWGVDTLTCIAFNPIQTNVLATCGGDNSIIIYDTRNTGPVRKLVMTLRSNFLSWNPMEAFVFTCANEDYNLYTFDARFLSKAVQVHQDHVSAVIDVDYSPTGKEFVSGGYDKTVRIFECDRNHSRDVYHTKRMQRLACVQWSMDNKYIMCGSDEMNIRLWKAHSNEKLGLLNPREKAALNYSAALREKFAHHPEVKMIDKHRHVPKFIYNARKQLRSQNNANRRKDINRRDNSKPNSVQLLSARKKSIVKEHA